MASNERPFDQTIWDPTDPEQAIEDPMHGPSAVHSLLQIPPMPRGDGTYYQPGGSYAFGTPLLDALDRPIYEMGGSVSDPQATRDTMKLSEWISASREGEETLKTLEANRQRTRLEQTGFTHSFKSSDVCAGGERIDACETAKAMVAEAQHYTVTPQEGGTTKGTAWTTLAWLGKTCTRCLLSCDVAVQTDRDNPTGIIRFTNSPLPDIRIIEV